MKERFSHELTTIQKLFGMWRINKDSVDFKWGYFAPKFGFELVINRGTYFDQYYAINICIVWGTFQIKLPIKTSLPEGCDMPRYGVEVHNNTVWFHFGGHYDASWGQMIKERGWNWDIPFFTLEFDGREELSPKLTYPYSYKLSSGEVQKLNATCQKEQWKWHRKWFPFLTKTRTCIDIEFDNEVGEGSGSWKGGVIGCSYDLLPGESVEECLRRMEKERIFTR